MEALNENLIRIDKYLAQQGVASRRDIKSVLKQGLVRINGTVVKEPGVKANPSKDEILYRNRPIKGKQLVYFLLNKPMGVVSTVDDEFGRKNVVSFIKTKERVYPVGRLDQDTRGLLLLTNDGDLTLKLTHPRYHVPKVYRLTVEGKVSFQKIALFQKGVKLDDGLTQPANLSITKENASHTILEATLHEGRKRQIRRMCEVLRINLTDLQRIKIGPIDIGDLQEGTYRQLTQVEVNKLKNVTSHSSFLTKNPQAR